MTGFAQLRLVMDAMRSGSPPPAKEADIRAWLASKSVTLCPTRVAATMA